MGCRLCFDMRTIKFRGKRVDNGAWIDGFVLFSEDKSEAAITKLTDAESFCENVIYDTIGQFTGLLDKNGKEIYEGDVVRYDAGGECEVSYCLGGGFAGFDLSPAFTNENTLTDVEIIGNIHDNPEF